MTEPMGEFTINHSWFLIGKDRWPKLLPVFAQMVILRAEMYASNVGITYQALSRLFAEVSAGYEIPKYYVQVRLDALNEIQSVRALPYNPNREIRVDDEWRYLDLRY